MVTLVGMFDETYAGHFTREAYLDTLEAYSALRQIYSATKQYQSHCLNKLAELIPTELHPLAEDPVHAFYEYCSPTREGEIYLSDMREAMDKLDCQYMARREVFAVCSVFRLITQGREMVSREIFTKTLRDPRGTLRELADKSNSCVKLSLSSIPYQSEDDS